MGIITSNPPRRVVVRTCISVSQSVSGSPAAGWPWVKSENPGVGEVAPGTGLPPWRVGWPVKAGVSAGLSAGPTCVRADSLRGWQLGEEAEQGTATWLGVRPSLALGPGHACGITRALWLLSAPPRLHSITPQLLRNLSARPTPPRQSLCSHKAVPRVGEGEQHSEGGAPKQLSLGFPPVSAPPP